MSCETSQLDQNCEGENNLLIADMEAVLKKMKALRDLVDVCLLNVIWFGICR